MTTRWDVERALMWSNLRPLARFVVLALATKSDASSGIVPAEHSPSLGTLHEMTGIAKSQVVKELDYLEPLGWVKRARPNKPSRNGRTSYAIAVGTDDPDRPTGPHHGQDEPVRTTDRMNRSAPRTGSDVRKRSNLSAPRTGSPTDATDKHSPAETDQPVRTTDRTDESTGPHHGHASTTSKPKTKRTTKASPSSSTSDEVDNPNAGQLLKRWIDYCTKGSVKLPKQLIGRYAAGIKAALDDKFDPEVIERALVAMYAQKAINTPAQLPAFLVQIQTGPREWANRGAPPPYQNPTNDDDYDDWNKNAPPTKR